MEGPIYTHHLWGNLNYPMLTNFTFGNYYCDGIEGYARIIQWIFKDTNWREMHCLGLFHEAEAEDEAEAEAEAGDVTLISWKALLM